MITKKSYLKCLFLIICSLSNYSVFSQSADDFVENGLKKKDALNYSGAIQDFTKAISLNSKLYTAYYYRAQTKDKLEDYRGEIAD